MLVPRSYKYRSPPGDGHGSRASSPRRTMRSTPTSAEHSPARSPAVSPQRRPRAEPVTIPSPKPAHVAAADERERERERARSRDSTKMSATQKAATIGGGRSKRTAHDPNSLPPAVAALLAMTAIPPRRPNRYRTRPGHDSHVSIEELVSSWKSDDSLRSSYGSPGLSMLLEDGDDVEDCVELKKDGAEDESYFNVRSSSSESMPSLEADDRSVLSFGSLSTPESLRSRRSITNLRRSEKQRYVPAVEECPVDHPLAAQSDEDEDDILHLPTRGRTPQPRKQSSFKSNLTLSLQSLKNAAINSISSLSRSAPGASSLRPTPPQIDDTLWSHPFLFPRLSSEVRPALDIKHTRRERQYLNPMPLTFEEQEAPFQKALHAPYLKEISEDDNDAPTIQMQTYNRRGNRKLRRGGNHPVDPKSEAGRALLGAEGGRQREVRENSDFLRIVVMEMNMRRVGKLESGRAKIWLPPREATVIGVSSSSSLGERKVPRRWVGVSAY